MEPSELLAWLGQTAWGVITFQVFISSHILMLVYYLGAVGIPLFAIMLSARIRQRLPETPALDVQIPEAVETARGRVAGTALLIFIVLEIVWRMLFEFLLAYFQIRDALIVS